MRTILRADEKVILEVSKHWIVLMKPAFIMAIASVIFIFMAGSDVQFIKASRWYAFLVICISGFYLWYCIRERKVNLWIITNLRVISEEGLFTWQAKESPIDKINNMQYRQTVFGRMLDFGDVEIQTAAEAGATIDQYVSHPKRLHDTVVEMQESLGRSQTSSRAVAADAPRAGDEVECPFCAETVRRKAKICKHCGKELPAQDMAVKTEKREITSPAGLDNEGPVDTLPGGMR